MWSRGIIMNSYDGKKFRRRFPRYFLISVNQHSKNKRFGGRATSAKESEIYYVIFLFFHLLFSCSPTNVFVALWIASERKSTSQHSLIVQHNNQNLLLNSGIIRISRYQRVHVWRKTYTNACSSYVVQFNRTLFTHAYSFLIGRQNCRPSRALFTKNTSETKKSYMSVSGMRYNSEQT